MLGIRARTCSHFLSLFSIRSLSNFQRSLTISLTRFWVSQYKRELWIREASNLRILAKIKFSRIFPNQQSSLIGCIKRLRVLVLLELVKKDKTTDKKLSELWHYFPILWYVRPAKAQTSLRTCAVSSEPLLVAWMFYDCQVVASVL